MGLDLTLDWGGVVTISMHKINSAQKMFFEACIFHELVHSLLIDQNHLLWPLLGLSFGNYCGI